MARNRYGQATKTLSTMKCYSCNEELLSGNLSEEHIFPNAIGGKIVSKKILCGNCNIKFGIYDKEIDKIFGAFVVHYGIKRDRDGYHPPVYGVDEATNKSVMLHSNRPRTFTDPVTEFRGNTFTISAYNAKRANLELEKIKKEMEKKGLRVDTSEMKIENDTTEDKHVTYVDLIPDYYILLRGIVRIFLNLYIDRFGQNSIFKKAIEFVNDTQVKIPNRFCTYYFTDLRNGIHTGKVLHSIVFKNEKNFIKGYMELFGAVGFIALLSNEYKGKDFNLGFSYEIDTFEESELFYSFDERIDQIIEEIRRNEEADTSGLMNTIVVT